MLFFRMKFLAEKHVLFLSCSLLCLKFHSDPWLVLVPECSLHFTHSALEPLSGFILHTWTRIFSGTYTRIFEAFSKYSLTLCHSKFCLSYWSEQIISCPMANPFFLNYQAAKYLSLFTRWSTWVHDMVVISFSYLYICFCITCGKFYLDDNDPLFWSTEQEKNIFRNRTPIIISSIRISGQKYCYIFQLLRMSDYCLFTSFFYFNLLCSL